MSESVRAIERALDLLMCFSQDEPALSLTRLAEQVSVPKSTAHRLLTTLESKRFVTRNKSTGVYQLGLRFLEMAALLRGFGTWAFASKSCSTATARKK